LNSSSSSESTIEQTPFDAVASAPSPTLNSTDEPNGLELEGVEPEGVEASNLAQRQAELEAREAAAAQLEQRRAAARAQAIQRVKAGRATKVLLGLVVFFVLVLGGIQYKREMLRQWRNVSIPMPVDRIARVPERWDPPTLAKRLASTGKIRDSGTFLEIARALGMKDVAPGGYELPPKAGPDDLVRLFMAGPTMEKVTFPEGFTCRRIAQRLRARHFKFAPDLLKLAYPRPDAPSPLEGRWFPDTYLLSRNAPAQKLSDRLGARFSEVVGQLPSSLPKVKGKALTQTELITLASIVERETSAPAERPIIAGVLLNRLNQKMRLECDATVQYARELAQANGLLAQGHKEKLSYRDIDAVKKSPYNTYERKGLPPGPICNPGRAALEAAARPRASKYLFYVMSPALGRHRFSVAYAQFLKDKALYKQERATLKPNAR